MTGEMQRISFNNNNQAHQLEKLTLKINFKKRFKS